jgi:hypothetical protein
MTFSAVTKSGAVLPQRSIGRVEVDRGQEDVRVGSDELEPVVRRDVGEGSEQLLT